MRKNNLVKPISMKKQNTLAKIYLYKIFLDTNFFLHHFMGEIIIMMFWKLNKIWSDKKLKENSHPQNDLASTREKEGR
jgi:hypothetical protein